MTHTSTSPATGPGAAGRTRPDRCPGLLRPWPAADGALTRIRLVGGRLTVAQLHGLLRIAAEHGDGTVHLTGRANLQLRALPADDGVLPEALLQRFEALGLLPSRAHDRVRNVLVSPQTGLADGRADLRPVAAALDAALLADPGLVSLPGRFLFVLDDGRGDLADRPADLGLVALDADHGQLRLGDRWGETLPLRGAAGRLTELARTFLQVRGDGPAAAWHVRELADPAVLAPEHPADPRATVTTDPLPYGAVPGGTHVAVPDGLLTSDLADEITAATAGPVQEHDVLVVTPWRGVLVPDLPTDRPTDRPTEGTRR